MDDEGVFRIPGAPVDAVFIDPPALLSSGYVDFALESSTYYARNVRNHEREQCIGEKRKRKKKKAVLNPKEVLAQQRHQEAREILLESHKAFMSNEPAQAKLKEMVKLKTSNAKVEDNSDFIALSQTFQAPLYDITLSSQGKCVPLFNNLVEASSSAEEVASSAGSDFLLPKNSRFLMTDFSEIHRLIPDSPSTGYNLIIIDPPWENKSVHRRSIYPTLPNKYLLSLPLQQLVHSSGALIGLWITNREKLHQFVEKELFPAWKLIPVGVWYWLKITDAGTMVSELDLNHHKPYECLLVASTLMQDHNDVPHRRVAITVPGQHSRKPPLGVLLADFAPKPVRALELFAREMNANWTSWGNEPLRFQGKSYFVERVPEDLTLSGNDTV
ncbi:methyltransferase-like protein 2 isoform X2 [Selaginella moellendorffii]|uniref:methyltransferase-like protein 2 isoform X2 n=1 Tax=Selaginella moellendorffii TaxID=88036 RepID=UPI000D1CA866|nr:methyltransferase-like protein 2 isoform X2 [Selaginella moellendorffii]|eukprot:XP_024542332.1 methyltransferase-like protein 2 isoform X2 [Selaginella moellendorffii]